MSYLAIKWSYESRAVLKAGLSGSALNVLRALCWVCRDENVTRLTPCCYPGVRQIARLAGLKSGAVNKAKRELQEKGLINWTRAANFPNSTQRTNSYTINCPELQRKLKAGKARLRVSDDYDDFSSSSSPRALPAGMDYFRPDSAKLASALSLPPDRAAWLADALAFVCDRPENRLSLKNELDKAADLTPLRTALEHVKATSAKGRFIANRTGYLVKAIRTEMATARG